MKPQQSRQLLGVIIFFVAIFLLFTIFSWSRPVPVLTRSVVDPNLKLKEITYITATTEDEWLPVLRHGKIISFKNIDSEVVGLADKYKIIFESGHQAIAKLVEPFSYFDREWQTISFLDPRVDESISPKRAGSSFLPSPFFSSYPSSLFLLLLLILLLLLLLLLLL